MRWSLSLSSLSLFVLPLSLSLSLCSSHSERAATARQMQCANANISTLCFGHEHQQKEDSAKKGEHALAIDMAGRILRALQDLAPFSRRKIGGQTPLPSSSIGEQAHLIGRCSQRSNAVRRCRRGRGRLGCNCCADILERETRWRRGCPGRTECRMDAH